MDNMLSKNPGIPRLYAAASLKRRGGSNGHSRPTRYSAALCRGLIEASSTCGTRKTRISGIPRLYAAASLKPPQGGGSPRREADRIPRLYAAASLKHGEPLPFIRAAERYSAALCRGLIEAKAKPKSMLIRCTRYSAALCRGLIEAVGPARLSARSRWVFRGFMPRPH